MAEIRQDYASKAPQRRDTMEQAGGASAGAKEHFHAGSVAGRVLFIVKDSMAQAQLRDVLVAGIDRVRDQRYRWFISQQAAEIRSRVRKQYAQQQHQAARRSSGYKRPAGSAGVNGTEQPNSKAGRADDSSRNAFLFPNEAELMSTADPAVPLPGQGNSEFEQSGLMGLPDKWFQGLPEENKLMLIEVRFSDLLALENFGILLNALCCRSTACGLPAHPVALKLPVRLFCRPPPRSSPATGQRSPVLVLALLARRMTISTLAVQVRWIRSFM